MLNMELARKYARAIFELACEENALSAYGNDLAKVQQTYVDCPELKAYLCNPNIQPEDKKSLLKEVFGDDVREMVLNFLLLLIDKRRMMVFEAISAIFVQLSNEKLGIAVADVTTVEPLSEMQKAELMEKLGRVTGKRFPCASTATPRSSAAWWCASATAASTAASRDVWQR